ncbi:hypothetical protein D6C98_06949 [Aureobasidium pullulans]|nr:hypothetical protein D6C98_06949 [Aureobasidium pullulans]
MFFPYLWFLYCIAVQATLVRKHDETFSRISRKGASFENPSLLMVLPRPYSSHQAEQGLMDQSVQ